MDMAKNNSAFFFIILFFIRLSCSIIEPLNNPRWRESGSSEFGFNSPIFVATDFAVANEAVSFDSLFRVKEVVLVPERTWLVRPKRASGNHSALGDSYFVGSRNSLWQDSEKKDDHPENVAGRVSASAKIRTKIFSLSTPATTAIVLANARTLANGSFQFTFAGAPGTAFTALATTNASLPLNSWTVIGAATEDSPGHFQFTDSQTPNYPQRFYRVRSP
jgi:hypothetical protein